MDLQEVVLPHQEPSVVISGILESRMRSVMMHPRLGWERLVTDSFASKPNALFRIEDRSLYVVSRLAGFKASNSTHLPHKGFNTASTTVHLIEGNFSYNGGAVISVPRSRWGSV